jgi:hypothetical protein
MKIEQFRPHRIFRLTFDNRMNGLEQNKNTKARAEKKKNIIKCLAHTKVSIRISCRSSAGRNQNQPTIEELGWHWELSQSAEPRTSYARQE